MKGNHFKKIEIMLIAMLFIIISGYMLISTAIAALAQDVDVSKVKNVVDVNLEKYVNYNLDEKKGTLLQLNVKTGIEYEEGTEYVPLSSTGILLNVPKINNKFPQSVEVFEKSTKATNGDEQGKDVRYKYVSETGQIIILTANEEQNGEIYKEYVKDAKDDISIVLDYDESCRLEENTKNQLDITGFVQTKLATQNETKVQGEIKAQIEIEKQVSNVVSSDVKTSDIYNGFIKMNVKNNSNYKTTYNESFGINISKKDLADETKIEIENSFIKNEEKTAIKDISYVSSKINKNRVLDIFGQDGYFKVLDETGKVLAEINKDTQVDKDGNYEIKYADGVSKLFAVFSKPNKVGYININSTKEIEPSFKELDVNKLQVISKIKSVNKIKDVQNNEIEKEVYNFEDTKEIEIKNTQSVVKLSVNNAKWTNQKQNDVELNVKLLASESSHSLFKNPIIKILLPEEVEKVVLGNVKVTNGNGLNFKNAEYNNENRILTVTLEGEQAEYLSKNLAEGTNVIIPASIILGQEIESKNTKLGVAYVNEATSEKGMFKVDVEVENFRQVQNTETEINTSVPSVVRQVQRAALKSETPNVETAEGVEIEVVPTRCTDILNNGDTVYEGEFIKYNVKVKNTSNDTLENVKLIADLPDGVEYVEVKENYNSSIEQSDIEDAIVKFEYADKRNLELTVGTLEKGQEINKNFEVRVKDLLEDKQEEQIETIIRVKSSDRIIYQKSINYKVLKADYKVSLLGYPIGGDNFFYILDVKGNSEEKVKVELDFSKNLRVNYISKYETQEIIYNDVPANNVVELKPDKYIINVIYDRDQPLNADKIQLKALAVVNDIYKSNLSIVNYKIEDVYVEMTSNSEGQKLSDGEIVTYNIKVKNNPNNISYIAKDLVVKIRDRLPEELNPVSMKYTYYNWNAESNIYEKQEKEEVISNVPENDKDAYNVDLELVIPNGKEAEVLVTAEVGLVFEEKTISNSAFIQDSAGNIGKIYSNVITNVLKGKEDVQSGEGEVELPQVIEEPSYGLEESDNNGEDGQSNFDYPNNEEDLNNPEDINIPQDTENPGDSEKPNDEQQSNTDDINNENNKYSITGIAWKDENENGEKEFNEEKLIDVEVLLLNSNGQSVSKTTTDSNGQYAFNNLDNGNYIVVFKYDTNKYRLTEYQKNGVESKYNSDAIKTEREIDGKSTICGVTNSIKLNSNLENIDVGLIENKKFNFKVDNYISKVMKIIGEETVSNEYDNVKLAKTEIKTKEIENTSVSVEYKIIISNDGEVPGAVGKVIVKLPKELKLSSDVNNKAWYQNKDGSLLNTSMIGQIIEPGKSLELELTADVSNASDIIGNYKNTVIIEDVSNNLGIPETNIKDNSSSAELIVSVSTGVIFYISIIIAAIICIFLITFLSKKYNVRHVKTLKLFIFIALFMGALISGINYSEGQSYIVNRTIKGVPSATYIYTPTGWIPNGHVIPSYENYVYKEGGVNGTWEVKTDNVNFNNQSDAHTYKQAFFWCDQDCPWHRDSEYWNSLTRCFRRVTTIYRSGSDTRPEMSGAQGHKGLCIDQGHVSTTLNAQDSYNNRVGEYYSPKEEDVKKLNAKYSYQEHFKSQSYTQTTNNNAEFYTKNSSGAQSKKGKAKVNYVNGKYLVGPLYINSKCAGTYYNEYNNVNGKYGFRVYYKNGTYDTIYKAYNANGTEKTSVSGSGDFYIELTEAQLSKQVQNVETKVACTNQRKRDKLIVYYRIYWACDRHAKYQRVVEVHEAGQQVTETIQGAFTEYASMSDKLQWEVEQSGNARITKKDEYGADLDFSKVQFVFFNNSLGWVKGSNNRATSYGAWGSNVIKLGMQYSKVSYVLSNLIPGKYSIYEIVPDNLAKYYDSKSFTNAGGQKLKLIDNNYEVKAGILNEFTCIQTRDFHQIKIEKKDEIGDVSDLSGINFIFYRITGSTNNPTVGWLMQDPKTERTFVGGEGNIWNNDNKQNVTKLAKLTTDKNGSTKGIYVPEGEYLVYEFIEGCDAASNALNIPTRLKKYYSANCTVAGCSLKKITTSIKLKNDSSSGANNRMKVVKAKELKTYEVRNTRDKVKLTINKTDEFKNEKIDLSNINFLLYRQKNEYGAPDGRGWAAYDSDGLIEYVSWGDSTRSNINKLAVMTTKKVGNEYVTNQIEGLERGYYTVYEFVEGCDTDTNKLNLPEDLRKYYKGSTSKQAGCSLKTVGYINLTNGFKQLYDANGKYVGDIDSNGKIYDSTGKIVTSLSYDSSKTKQFPAFNISANKGKKVADVSNKRDFVDLKLHKEDENEKVNLEGIQFKVYKHEFTNSLGKVEPAGWVKWTKNAKGVYQIDEDQTKAVTTYDKSSTLTTDNKGDTEQIEKLLVDRKYSIYEVSVGTYEKQYEIGPSNGGVKMPDTDKYGKLIETWTAKANKEGVYNREVDNDQYYVSLNGDVWEDYKEGKNIKTIDNLYVYGRDKEIHGIVVKLVDKSGKVIKQTKTDLHGKYNFDKVLVSELKAGNYHIEFEYDGLIYQAVHQDKTLRDHYYAGTKEVKIPTIATSKAGETSSRTDLNNSFTALTGDGQNNISYNGKNITLNYEKRGDDVYSPNTCKWDWVRTEPTNGGNGTVKINTQGDFKVTATIDADYLKNAYITMKEGYKDNTKSLFFTIPNLNLGLYQREQVDLALSKDTYSAQIDINGKKYTYLYGQKLDESVQNLIEKDIQTAQIETSLGVGFERKNPLSDDLKYKAPIHKADAEYNLDNDANTDSNGELKVTITYAIGLVNNSPTLYGKVNKIKEYYSSDCTFVDKKVYLDKECTTPLSGVTIENESTLNNAQLDKDTVSRNYKTFDINFGNSGIVLTPKTNKDCVKYIYVKMELPKTSFYDFVNHRVYEDKEFRNFAEISSYTTYSAYNANNKTGTLYATFDYNSVPNTINTKNAKLRKYENDSNFAPGLQLVLAEERTLSGVVFEDKPIETLLNFQRRQGDGFRGYFDKGIKGVTVQLVPTSLINVNTDKFAQEYEFANVTAPNVDTVNNYYVSKGLTDSILTTTTDENGKFELKGIVPGNYQIRYIWGLNNGTTLSDGTKVSVGEYKSTMYYEHSSYNPKEWYLTSLLDGRKPQVNNHSEAIDSWKERLDFDHELTASYNDYNINTPKLNQSMNSWTDVLDMSVEVVGDVNNGYKIVEENGDVKYKYDIKSIDFGLIERPHQQLVISKELKKLKIKDSQDRVIVDAEVIEENGKKTFKNIKDVLYTVFLPESSTNPSGTVKSEIDKDYMPVTIEATYNVSVINAGEYDFKTQKWYYSNSADFRNDEKVTLRATDVYDYLANNFDIEASDSNYEVITKEDYNNKISESRIEAGYSNQFKDWRKSENKTITAADGSIITLDSWKYGNAILSTLYERWYNETTASKTIRDVKVDGTKIINLTDLSKPLAAGESSTASYTVTSLVQNKDDEIRLDNEAEIIEIERSSDFGKSRIETYKTLYDGGESVIITPPTGENRSKEEVNILAISLASGLGVLAIGLIFIKRRISKHNKNA